MEFDFKKNVFQRATIVIYVLFSEPKVKRKEPVGNKLRKRKKSPKSLSKVIVKHIEETDKVYDVDKPDTGDGLINGRISVSELRPPENYPQIINPFIPNMGDIDYNYFQHLDDPLCLQELNKIRFRNLGCGLEQRKMLQAMRLFGASQLGKLPKHKLAKTKSKPKTKSKKKQKKPKKGKKGKKVSKSKSKTGKRKKKPKTGKGKKVSKSKARKGKKKSKTKKGKKVSKPKTQKGKKKPKTKKGKKVSKPKSQKGKKKPKTGKGKKVSKPKTKKGKKKPDKKKSKTGKKKKKPKTGKGKKKPKPSNSKPKSGKGKKKPMKSKSKPKKQKTGKSRVKTGEAKKSDKQADSIVEERNSSMLEIRRVINEDDEDKGKMFKVLYLQDNEEPSPKSDLPSEIIAKTFEKLSPYDQRKALRYIISRLRELSMLNSLVFAKKTTISSDTSLPKNPDDSNAYSVEIGIAAIPGNPRFSRRTFQNTTSNDSFSHELFKSNRFASTDKNSNATKLILSDGIWNPRIPKETSKSDYITSADNTLKNSERVLKDIITYLRKKVKYSLYNNTTLTDMDFNDSRKMQLGKKPISNKMKRNSPSYDISPYSIDLSEFEKNLQDILPNSRTSSIYRDKKRDASTYKTFSDFKKVLQEVILNPRDVKKASELNNDATDTNTKIDPKRVLHNRISIPVKLKIFPKIIYLGPTENTFGNSWKTPQDIISNSDEVNISPEPVDIVLNSRFPSDSEESLQVLPIDRVFDESIRTLGDTKSNRNKLNTLSELNYFPSTDRTLGYSRQTFQDIISFPGQEKKFSGTADRIPSYSGKIMNDLSNSEKRSFLKPINAMSTDNTIRDSKNLLHDVILSPNKEKEISDPMTIIADNRISNGSDDTLGDIISNLNRLKEIFERNDNASTDKTDLIFYSANASPNKIKVFSRSNNVTSVADDSIQTLQDMIPNPRNQDKVSESNKVVSTERIFNEYKKAVQSVLSNPRKQKNNSKDGSIYNVLTLYGVWNPPQVTALNHDKESKVSNSDDVSIDGVPIISTDISTKTQKGTTLSSEQLKKYSKYFASTDKTPGNSGEISRDISKDKKVSKAINVVPSTTNPEDAGKTLRDKITNAKKVKTFSEPINYASTDRDLGDSSKTFQNRVSNHKKLKTFSKTYYVTSTDRTHSDSKNILKKKALNSVKRKIFSKSKQITSTDKTVSDSIKSLFFATMNPNRLNDLASAEKVRDDSKTSLHYSTLNPSSTNKLTVTHNIALGSSINNLKNKISEPEKTKKLSKTYPVASPYVTLRDSRKFVQYVTIIPNKRNKPPITHSNGSKESNDRTFNTSIQKLRDTLNTSALEEFSTSKNIPPTERTRTNIQNSKENSVTESLPYTEKILHNTKKSVLYSNRESSISQSNSDSLSNPNTDKAKKLSVSKDDAAAKIEKPIYDDIFMKENDDSADDDDDYLITEDETDTIGDVFVDDTPNKQLVEYNLLDS
ncbi:hypothetical protein NPIL_391181 [Nephila pilipes]|uniref:Uncharacterized protein n=1 Tax=Nephila pilipes TaxID=299642 RepID=A0A8X6ULE0_NEPPI|nr:hypothetical protein NPIL_391181 [Nephila pilipes]